MPCCSFSKEGALPISCVWLGVQLRDSSALRYPIWLWQVSSPLRLQQKEMYASSSVILVQAPHLSMVSLSLQGWDVDLYDAFPSAVGNKSYQRAGNIQKKPTDKKSSRTTWLVLWASYFHLEVFIFRATEKQVVSNLWSPDTALLPKGSPNHAG